MRLQQMSWMWRRRVAFVLFCLFLHVHCNCSFYNCLSARKLQQFGCTQEPLNHLKCVFYFYFASLSDYRLSLSISGETYVRITATFLCFCSVFFFTPIPLKAQNRNLLSSRRDKRRLFLSESSLRRLTLMLSALHILFGCLAPKRCSKNLKFQEPPEGFSSFFFLE